MKHPVRSEFDTAVTEAGVTVTFKHGQHLQFSLIGLRLFAGVQHARNWDFLF
jgi:hypothetical protein